MNEPPNKALKLTNPEPIEGLQLSAGFSGPRAQ